MAIPALAEWGQGDQHELQGDPDEQQGEPDQRDPDEGQTDPDKDQRDPNKDQGDPDDRLTQANFGGRPFGVRHARDICFLKLNSGDSETYLSTTS